MGRGSFAMVCCMGEREVDTENNGSAIQGQRIVGGKKRIARRRNKKKVEQITVLLRIKNSVVT